MTSGHREDTRDWVDRAIQIPAAIIVIVMVLHVTANAVLRAYFQSPIRGTLEYTQYWYLPIIAFVGLVVAQRRREHVEARLLFDHFPQHVHHWVQGGINVLTMTLCGVFTYYTWEMAFASYELGRTGGVIGVTIWPAIFFVPFGFAMLTVQLMVDTVRVLRGGPSASVHDIEAQGSGGGPG